MALAGQTTRAERVLGAVMPREIWKAVPDYPGYEVSNQGRVRSFWGRGNRRRYGFRRFRPVILSPGVGSGYKFVALVNDTCQKRMTIAKLVLLTFCGPAQKGWQGRHLNGKRHDDRLCNLRYGTVQQNQLDRAKHGTSNRGERNTWHKLKVKDVRKIRRLLKRGIAQPQIAKRFHVYQATISSIKTGRIWGWLDRKEK